MPAMTFALGMIGHLGLESERRVYRNLAAHTVNRTCPFREAPHYPSSLTTESPPALSASARAFGLPLESRGGFGLKRHLVLVDDLGSDRDQPRRGSAVDASASPSRRPTQSAAQP